MRKTFLTLCLILALASMAQAQIIVTPVPAGAGTTTYPPGSDIRIAMATPAAPTITQDASGTLANGAYKMTLTAIDAGGGQTLYPTAGTCTVTAGTDDGCIATWVAVPGAVTYRVWISDTDGATPVQYFAVTAPTVTKTVTTLVGATVATLPTTATAYVVNLDSAGTSWVSGGPLVTGWVKHAAAGATETADLSVGVKHRIILDENLTLTLTNPVDSATYTIEFVQDAGATNTVTWADEANIYWSDGGVAPVITATANAISLCTFIYDGTLSKYLGACSLDHK
jgi:hypothetical protein